MNIIHETPQMDDRINFPFFISFHRFTFAGQKSTYVAHIADAYASDAPCDATKAWRTINACDK